MRPAFTLGLRQWSTVAVGLFLVLPVIVGISFQSDLHEAYLVQFKAPELQRDLGFRAESVPVPARDGTYLRQFTVTSVVPGGPFWQAGVRPGDIPFGYKHGFRYGFYLDLVAGRQAGELNLLFLRVAAADPHTYENPIRVILHFPPTQTPP